MTEERWCLDGGGEVLPGRRKRNGTDLTGEGGEANRARRRDQATAGGGEASCIAGASGHKANHTLRHPRA
ncbi:hypothetical protein Kim5_CH01122 [Rhizobium sp. Kim5]|nr:hypothetical protein Kim5_CH01122 [Rhizobium sp. Kim5]